MFDVTIEQLEQIKEEVEFGVVTMMLRTSLQSC